MPRGGGRGCRWDTTFATGIPQDNARWTAEVSREVVMAESDTKRASTGPGGGPENRTLAGVSLWESSLRKPFFCTADVSMTFICERDVKEVEVDLGVRSLASVATNAAGSGALDRKRQVINLLN